MGTTIAIAAFFLVGIGMLLFKKYVQPEPFTTEEPEKYYKDSSTTTATWRSWREDQKDYEKAVGEAATIRFGMTIVGFVAIGIAAMALFLSSFVTIQGNELGVPVTFGRVGAELKPGPHFLAPWTDVETYPTRPFPVKDKDAEARSAQNGHFSLTLGARWHTSDGRELWYQARSGDEKTISDTIVDPLLAQAARNVFSLRTNAQAIQDAVGNEQAIKAELQRLVDKYGITVDDVYVRKSEPDATTSSVIAQLTAQQQLTDVATAALATAKKQHDVVVQQSQNAKDAASTLPTDLSPQQVTMYCARLWADTEAAAIAKGVTLYTSPCSSASAPNILVGAK